ncbi:MAG: 50S ribosomal protein L17 [Coriobacteriales bacterium]|jgi:large subunit ribosomal protein L17|nr:50S ribosomal protein L17 [Coriobacteriales bacterium]
MRHYKKGRKLGTDASHTKAIKKSLCVALFTNDRIKTTLERAKEIRGDVDRIVTLAKRGDVHSRRLAIARLGDKDLVAEVFEKVAQGMFKDRPGGYTRIYKLGKRRGDSAVIVLMELVEEPYKKGGAKSTAPKPGDSGKKPAKKASGAEKETAKTADANEDAPTGEDDVKEDSGDAVEETAAKDADADDAAATEEEPAKADDTDKPGDAAPDDEAAADDESVDDKTDEPGK